MNARRRLSRTAVAVAMGMALAACGGGGGAADPVGGVMPAQAQAQSTVPSPAGAAAPAPAGIGGVDASLGIAVADGHQTDPALARLSDGGHVVAWTHRAGDAGSGSRVRLQRYDAAGAALGGEVELAATRNVAGRPAVAAMAGGGFVLTWTASDASAGAYPGAPAPGVDFFAQRFDAAARPLGAAVQVNTVPGHFFNGSQVVGLPDGGFVVGWSLDTGEATDPMRLPYVWLRRFDASGAPAGQEWRLRAGFEPQPSFMLAAAGEGGFVVAWEQWLAPDRAGVFLQSFDASAAPRGAEQRADGGLDPAPNRPALAALAGGGHVLAWDTGRSEAPDGRVVAQVLAADGRPGPRLPVATGALAVAAAPAVAGLADGGFVVSWLSARTDGSVLARELRAQRHDAAGSPLGPVQSLGASRVDASVRQAACGCQALAATQDGGFALAMQAYTPATGWDVWVGRR